MGKLTLSINQSVIEQAKAYAKSSGKSLSSIVEEYLKSLARDEPGNEKKPPSKIVKELRGSVKMPKEMRSYEEWLQEALIEKYVKK